MIIFFGFISFLVTVTASTSDIEGRIWKGFGAHEGAFPYMVRIQTLIKNMEFISGGSLISTRWVLTSAHSLQKPHPFIIHIYLGMTHIDDPKIGYALSSPDAVHIHPLFNRNTAQNDIALIEIPDTPSCTNIKPVHLPSLNTAQHKSYLGRIGIVVGWGKIGHHSELPVQLQFGRMRIIENKFCKDLKNWMSINQICIESSSEYSGTCPGDSGGPFVLESTGELVGVISSGTRAPCNIGYPSILTRITTHLDWIRMKTGIYY